MNKIKTTDKIKTNWPVMILLILGAQHHCVPPCIWRLSLRLSSLLK